MFAQNTTASIVFSLLVVLLLTALVLLRFKPQWWLYLLTVFIGLLVAWMDQQATEWQITSFLLLAFGFFASFAQPERAWRWVLALGVWIPIFAFIALGLRLTGLPGYNVVAVPVSSTFQGAEKTYEGLRLQHDSGTLSDADFDAQVNQLKVQDAQGRWWALGVRTGQWYFYDGQKWVNAKPPTVPVPVTIPESLLAIAFAFFGTILGVKAKKVSERQQYVKA